MAEGNVQGEPGIYEATMQTVKQGISRPVCIEKSISKITITAAGPGGSKIHSLNKPFQNKLLPAMKLESYKQYCLQYIVCLKGQSPFFKWDPPKANPLNLGWWKLALMK